MVFVKKNAKFLEVIYHKQNKTTAAKSEFIDEKLAEKYDYSEVKGTI